MFCCAFDLGASGGRVMVGEYDGSTLKLSEMHRFPNEPVTANGVLYWDVLRLFHEMKIGLKKIAAEKIPLASVGIDTWGVDYAFLDKQGHTIGAPIHYRDSRTAGYPSRPDVDLRSLYSRTGIQLLDFNTLFQIKADADLRPGILSAASDLLFVPDLFTYFLTGIKINEYTIASTSQLLNAHTRSWDDEVVASLGIPNLRGLLRPVVMPGTTIGPLTAEVLSETGLDPTVRMVAVGSHDTASAVAGTPLSGEDSAYISCGTWSLLGAELDDPCLSERAYEKQFTNEGGLDGKIRLLKNINGLWMMQRLLKAYNDQPNHPAYGFADLIREAEKVEHATFSVAPNDPSFTNPPDMATAVRAYCEKTGQGTPQSMGETAMAIYNGLCGEYATVLSDLESILEKPVTTLHMVGGGTRDTLLCKLTAKATERHVEAGPVEASALGNIVAQLINLKAVGNLAEGRALIRRSFEPVTYA